MRLTRLVGTEPSALVSRVERRGRYARRSFTLIELLVVVVLVGIAVTVIGVRLRGTSDAARLRAAAIQIERVLRQLQHYTQTRHKPAYLEIANGEPAALEVSGGTSAGRVAAVRVEGVVFVEAALSRQSDTVGSGETFRVRITPRGVSLPWSIELRSGGSSSVLSCDGIAARVRPSPVSLPSTS